MNTLTKEDYKTQRKVDTVNRVCLPVSKRKLAADDTLFSYKKELYGIFDHNSLQLSTVSKGYCLIPNEKLLMPFIKQFGINNLKTLYQYGNGR